MPRPRLSDADRLLRTMSEVALQNELLKAARLGRWRIAHFRPARLVDGTWRTPMIGDKGFPDLVLLRPPDLFFWEEKTQVGRVSPEQEEWLRQLSQVRNVGAGVIRPGDLDAARSRLLAR